MSENRRAAAIAARSADPSPRPRLPGRPAEAVDIRAAVREGMLARWGPLVCCALLAASAPYALAGAVDIPPAAATAVGLLAVGLIVWEMERHRAGIERRDRALNEHLRRQEAWIHALPVTLHRTALHGGESGRMWFSANVEGLTGFPAARFAESDGVAFYAGRVHPDDRGVFAAAFQHFFVRPVATNEYRWQLADGSYRWLLSQAVLLRSDKGEPSEAIGSLLDITERKQAEEELAKSELRHRLVTQVTHDAIWDWDLRSDAVRWNDAVHMLFGYAPDEVGLDCTWWAERIHPDDRERVVASIQHAIEYGSEWRDAYRFLCRDGRYALIEDRGRVVRDEYGRDQRMIGAMTDVTQRREAEDNLRRSEAYFRSLIEKSSDLFGIVNPDGTMRYASASHLRVLGYQPAELEGRIAIDFVHPDDLRAMAERFGGVITDAPIEFRFRHADGSWRVLESNINDLSADPDIGGIVVNSRDVTDRKRAEIELQRAKEAAEAASRVKSEFVANMSHEIRTPMNAILGMTELALDTELSGEQREYLESVRTAGDWLLTLINDLLDIAKLEAGKVVLDASEFSLRAMLEETRRILAPRARAKGLDLDCAVDPDVPDLLIGDPGRLRQVLVNLIGNGVKFADRGAIAVSVGCRPAPVAGGVDLHVRVRDTGIGIPPAQHATIFEPFEQADGSATRRYGGTGLGLAIARQLVGLMDGVIGVESDVGCGSTFYFTARLRRSAQEAIAKEAPASGSEERERSLNCGLRILLVEDNLVNQRVATRLLEKKGHQVSVADNGRAALHAYTRAPYDVVLMDVQMPEMDGLEATAAIRRHEAERNGAGRRVPIIAMTAHALSGDRERCLAAGMDDYVPKPIQSRALFEAIERVLSN